MLTRLKLAFDLKQQTFKSAALRAVFPTVINAHQAIAKVKTDPRLVLVVVLSFVSIPIAMQSVS